MRRTLIAAALVLGVACGTPTGIADSALAARAMDRSVHLENHSDRRIFYLMYEREAAALINWAQCVDPSLCPALAPGGRTTLPYSAIGGYESGKTEAIVWFWEAVPVAGPARRLIPGPVHFTILRL